MMKLVVFFALFALCSAKVSAVVVPVIHEYPSAVSHTSRVDIHSKPLIATAPVLAYSAPSVVYAAPRIVPSVLTAYRLPTAFSHQSRLDVHNNVALASEPLFTHTL